MKAETDFISAIQIGVDEKRDYYIVDLMNFFSDKRWVFKIQKSLLDQCIKQARIIDSTPVKMPKKDDQKIGII